MNNLLIEQINQEFENAIKKVSDIENLEKLRVGYIGRKGNVTKLLKELSSLSLAQRKEVGPRIQSVKEHIIDSLESKKRSIITKQNSQFKKITIELNNLGVKPIREQGHLHPITSFLREIYNIFLELGFSIEHGPEIETEWYNFEALNIGPNHPARDAQDTFYIADGRLLRTQTSTIQIRIMEKEKPPIKMIGPGKTFRRDDDITHTPMFHQCEGLYVDKNVTMGDLFGTLEYCFKKLLGNDVKLRFRSSFFPFVEPGLEVDISCTMCEGRGCAVCKITGWLEVAGAGMVHPKVFENVGIDSKKYIGFAFGFGLERLIMLRHGIDNLRLFFENDLRFLKQF